MSISKLWNCKEKMCLNNDPNKKNNRFKSRITKELNNKKEGNWTKIGYNKLLINKREWVGFGLVS